MKINESYQVWDGLAAFIYSFMIVMVRLEVGKKINVRFCTPLMKNYAVR